VHGGASPGTLGQSAFRKVAELEKTGYTGDQWVCAGRSCEMACPVTSGWPLTSQFGQPEVGLGITPDLEARQLLPRIIGEGRAKELIVTGGGHRGRRSLPPGPWSNRIYPADTLMDESPQTGGQDRCQAPLA
jgi:enoyl-CoA hydratase/carnithine racemase